MDFFYDHDKDFQDLILRVKLLARPRDRLILSPHFYSNRYLCPFIIEYRIQRKCHISIIIPFIYSLSLFKSTSLHTHIAYSVLPSHNWKLQAILETISTLKFANRAKNIRNEARVNEDLDQKSLLRKYERELKKLRAELEERSKNVVDKRRLLELDDQVK